MDGAEFLQRSSSTQFDLIYADGWPGKFSHLNEALSLLAPGGVYVIDDLLPQPNWPDVPLYHQTATDGHAGIPAWWFGAPVVAFLYVLVTPRFLPDVVSVPDALPAGLTTTIRWFIGLVVGVALATTWQCVRWARVRRR